jgi:uncharacterized membrane protein HdeD (DUF308 family)
MIVLVGNWWTFVLRGIVAVLFGLMTLFMPRMALLTLIFLFGFYAIADGVFNIAAAFSGRGPRGEPWWALLISGILGLIAGLIAFFWPGLTAMALLIIIAAWAIATGVMSIVAAVHLRKQIRGEWLLALTGVLAIIFGVLLVLFPRAGALTVVLWIGAFAFVYGILLIALGLRLRKWVRTIAPDAGGFAVVAPGH